MKSFVTLSVFMLSLQSFGMQLACWNLYAPSGARPALTATFTEFDKLSSVIVNESFKKADLKSEVSGVVLPNTYHTYKGLRGFTLAPGVLLILPLDLSSDNLAHTSIPGGNHPDARQNAVMEVEGGRVSDDQGGNSYYRMHCYSKL